MPILSENQLLNMANDLPSISATAIKLVSLIDNPQTTKNQIIDMIKVDKTLFAECFKQANSAAVASYREYKTINEIVDILGFDHIKKVAIYLSAKKIINDTRIWRESVFTAVAAQYAAKKFGSSYQDCDKIYMAALFLNYGSFVLKHFYPEIHQQLSKITDYRSRLEAEKKEFGFSHPEISAIILNKFQVPQYICKLISSQINTYTDSSSKENAFIEIGRILFSVQEKDFNFIQSRLNLSEVQDLVKRSAIELIAKDFAIEELETIKKQTGEFV